MSRFYDDKPSDFPRANFRDCTVLGLDVVDTCTSHPEQYSVFLGDERVGYLRMRGHRFNTYLKEPGGNPLGSYESESYGMLYDEERAQVIEDAVESIIHALNCIDAQKDHEAASMPWMD
jgi:hypothetical protein